MSALNLDELQKPRLAEHFMPWVNHCYEEFRQHKDSNRGGSEEVYKKLREEIEPLGIFASLHYGDTKDVIIQPIFGNQPFDAIIIDHRANKSPFKYVEVTQAHEGEDEHLREVVLQRDKHVNAFAPVVKSGTKASRLCVKVPNSAVAHDTLQNKALHLIDVAIKRKINKNYPPNTALLVIFDDYVLFDDSQFINMLREHIQSLLPQLRIFCWVAVVGRSKHTILEFNLT